MTSVDTVISILLPIAGLWLASIEYRMRSMSERLSRMATKREITEEIKARQAVQKAVQDEIKDDISRVEGKIDKLFDMLVLNQRK